MLSRDKNKTEQVIFFSMEDFVPKDHLLRKIEETIEKVFYWILSEINKEGYLSPEAVFIDETHIKANANIKKKVKKAIPTAAKIYEEQLLKKINEDREKHGKEPFEPKDKGNKKDKEVTASKTDSDSGLFHKSEHKKCFAYEAHTVCDFKGYVPGVYVTPGNIHDSVAFDPLFDELYNNFPQINTVAADAAYKTTWISKKLIDKGIICPHLSECTKSKNHQKTITIHIWENYIEIVEDYRHTYGIREIYE